MLMVGNMKQDVYGDQGAMKGKATVMRSCHGCCAVPISNCRESSPDWVCQFPGLELAADRAIALQMGHESPALACHAAISSLLTLMLLVANFVNTK